MIIPRSDSHIYVTFPTIEEVVPNTSFPQNGNIDGDYGLRKKVITTIAIFTAVISLWFSKMGITESLKESNAAAFQG